jgi:polyhydroxyalkanoate synthesis repressor PhaR
VAAEPRLIKRYANRKLYDTARSSYITLDEIGQMIRDGQDVRIIDNKSKEDLTAVTMAQILVEDEKRQRRTGPLPTLRDLILHSGEILTRTTRSIAEPVTQIRTSVEESVQRLIRSGEERAEETREGLRAWVESQTRAVEEMQQRFDERVRVVTGGLTVIGRVQRELQALRARVEHLEGLLKRRGAEGKAGAAGPMAKGARGSVGEAPEHAGAADDDPGDAGPPEV